MEFLPQKIEAYSLNHTTEEPPILQEINRDTHAEVLKPRMLSGNLQGRFLSMLSHMIKPSRILEIGTFTGYSAICLAEGLSDNGKLITIDINEELESRVRAYIKKANLESKIDYRIGDALILIPTLHETFDLVFIDADKINYLTYYQLIFNKVKKGGYIIIDNVLWSGKIIIEEGAKIDKDTAAILEFNTYIQNDTSVENVLAPIRDGLMIVRKK